MFRVESVLSDIKYPDEYARHLKTTDFSFEALEILQDAEAEARRYQHKSIGTEHIALAAVRQKENEILLGQLNVRPNQVRAAVEFIVGRGDGFANYDLSFTERAKKVVYLTYDQAIRDGFQQVYPRHFLIGLMRADEGIAAGVFFSLGLGITKVKCALENLPGLIEQKQKALVLLDNKDRVAAAVRLLRESFGKAYEYPDLIDQYLPELSVLRAKLDFAIDDKEKKAGIENPKNIIL